MLQGFVWYSAREARPGPPDLFRDVGMVSEFGVSSMSIAISQHVMMKRISVSQYISTPTAVLDLILILPKEKVLNVLSLFNAHPAPQLLAQDYFAHSPLIAGAFFFPQ